MVAIQKAIQDITGSDEKALQSKERLELLRNAAEAHLQLAEDRLSAMLLGTGGGISSLFIVPGSVQNFQQGYTITTGEKAAAGIDTAVDQFFTGKYKDGFKTVVHSAIDVLFSDTTTGETKKDFYFVTMEHNAFIRVDVAFWKYYFTQKSITDTAEQAFCYTFVKSVVDHRKVPLDTIVFLVSSSVGDDLAKVQEYLDEMRKLYADLSEHDPAEVAARVAS
ncbi:hypothetical protein Cme02nite_27680 [Catellatospora methionotrophica]|uniref:Uncharacterized protein n=1 Tax=Catellatospora methionotrophica TaxID=121620 RepID=A0A8J3LFZ0_9ACTN|nr:hypothetical protein [Catellatospora methionotrophica]GIG14436.1 hypothetical protein Cme02nite_27680 [Catellatospora methionotrophica]